MDIVLSKNGVQCTVFNIHKSYFSSELFILFVMIFYTYLPLYWVRKVMTNRIFLQTKNPTKTSFKCAPYLHQKSTNWALNMVLFSCFGTKYDENLSQKGTKKVQIMYHCRNMMQIRCNY